MRVMLIQPPMFHLEMNIAPNIGLAYIVGSTGAGWNRCPDGRCGC